MRISGRAWRKLFFKFYLILYAFNPTNKYATIMFLKHICFKFFLKICPKFRQRFSQGIYCHNQLQYIVSIIFIHIFVLSFFSFLSCLQFLVSPMTKENESVITSRRIPSVLYQRNPDTCISQSATPFYFSQMFVNVCY